MKSNQLIVLFFRFVFTGSQDEYVLKKVYAELLQYNPTMKKSSKLEKLAQSHGCVRNHADHRNSWQDKAALRNDPGRRKTLSSIIGKVGCFSDRNSIRFPIRIPKEFLNNSTSIFSRTTVQMDCALWAAKIMQSAEGGPTRTQITPWAGPGVCCPGCAARGVQIFWTMIFYNLKKFIFILS